MTQSQAAEAQSFETYEAIATALQPYIDSARTGNGASIRSSLTDDFRITGHLQGEFINLGPDDFCAAVSNLGATPDPQSRILSIDVAGRSACARLEFLNWAGVRFTDFLLLYRQDDGWKIASKVFTAHSRS